MAFFSPPTLAYLTQAGWFPGRKVSVVKYRAYLTGQGYSWLPEVAMFLEEFGDLLVKFRRENDAIDTLDFRACDAGADFDSRWVQEDHALRVGSIGLCVIGQAYSDHLLLFMDHSGKVYGGFDEYLCVIGQTGIDAIENMCSNHRLVEIK